MAVHMSEQEARRAGLVKGKGSTRKRADGGRKGAASRCATCGETFTSDTAEDAHLATTGHNRYETVIS